MLVYYLMGIDKTTITTANTLTITNKISKYRFDQCIKRGTGYSEQCFYFSLDKYSCDFKASAVDNNEVEKMLDTINIVKITIEKTDTVNLGTNKTVEVLSFALNNKILVSEDSGIDNRNLAIKYFLPILTIICFLFGFKDLYKAAKK